MAQVVWLKRDLRLHDQAALASASRIGAVVLLYVYEPDVYAAPEHDPSHLAFVNESLADLDEALKPYGGRITYRQGTMPDVLARLSEDVVIDALWSHEETGTDATYRRDQRVHAWCRSQNVPWTEIPQFGVFRRQPSRDGWAKRWERRMSEPIIGAPDRIDFAPVDPERRRIGPDLGVAPNVKDELQTGGSLCARALLAGFLTERGVNYRADMSSPVAGSTGCSRLSAHIAYGTISLRTVYQETREREAEVRAALADGEPLDRRWIGSLSSFVGRLHWHCHFMQKLEDQPSLEFVNQARSYDGLRENDFDETRFAAWCAGRTGFPMVDACMRALHRSGWVNFRMRAMLMSFASYHLWLHWRPTAIYLARQFLDFEPGIHYPQSQMQSGVTGINAIRIYSPAKQARDNDATGAYIRRYVPELARVPDEYLAEPHLMPPIVAASLDFRIGFDYPLPIVDHRDAVAAAKTRIYEIRRRASSRSEAASVYEKHGSRKPSPVRSSR
jgi:deoxyribodipyrimidine photo-lyase